MSFGWQAILFVSMVRLYWFFVIVKEVANEISDTGVCLAEGFDEEQGPDMNDVEYCLWWRASADSEEEAKNRVEDGVRNCGCGTSLLIESIKLDPKRLIRRERRLMRNADDAHLSFHDTWIACKAGHEPARQMARECILDAMTRKPWQFWK